MHSMDIMEHADKKTKNLSGGTKRKLAFAISMFGSPNIVVLDGKNNIRIQYGIQLS